MTPPKDQRRGVRNRGESLSRVTPGSNKRLVQINAWYVPRTVFTIYNTVFVIQKNAWFNLTPGLMAFENNERPGHIF